TRTTTAQALDSRATRAYKVTDVVEGLSKTDVRRHTKWLHELQTGTGKGRGITGEAGIFIRLAEAMGGFLIGALLEPGAEFQSLLEKAIKEGYLHRVGEK